MPGSLDAQEPSIEQNGTTKSDKRLKRVYPVEPHLTTSQLLLKRAFDIFVCLMLSPLALALSLLIALAIKIDSAGPVLYRQGRIGKHGKPFAMFKFRSMRKDAEELKKTLAEMNEAAGPIFKIKNDPRITRVGAILRKTSMDELPQLWNVLKGDMSLVGPRPPLPDEVAQYNDYQFGRLAVTPGITCIWQVEGRSNIGFDRWVELDLEYIRKQSFWLDFVLLLKTIRAVIKGTGAC